MSAADQYTGPWIAPDKVPKVRRQFDLSRDEYTRRQLLAMEAEQQQQSGGRGSGMVQAGVPHYLLHPPPHIRDPVNRDLFNAQWLAEQRDAALNQARAFHELHEHTRSHTRSIGRSR